jgi:hypothetical protein
MYLQEVLYGNKQEIFEEKLVICLHLPLTEKAGPESGSVSHWYVSADPDPYGTKKMSRIHNTDFE